jgi:predicted CoA-substrate-specific enzyme activase
MSYYLGVDVGSISVNLALINKKEEVLRTLYKRSEGRPLEILRETVTEFLGNDEKNISGVGVTGSGRNFIGHYINADTVKDEITAHSQAVLKYHPKARTIIEIGGQDSKLIIIEDHYVKDFFMNSVCAAGTGSFLDHQAERLKLSIEKFSDLATKSENPTNISGRCTVFAESDMIHKQQMGHSLEDIATGLCHSLAKNFLATLAAGTVLEKPIVFQGGVAANIGMRKAFNQQLKTKVIIPKHFGEMGAIGVALIAKRESKGSTRFRGTKFFNHDVERKTRFCKGCSNTCELLDLLVDGELIATMGGKCGKWG